MPNTENRVMMLFYCTPELRERIRKQAEKEERSISAILRRSADKYCDGKEAK
jgi:molybdopterin-guanine dinucleotide biosynthesis protein A